LFIDAHLGTLHEPLTGRRWDAAQAWARTRQRAAWLHRRGVRRGQRVFMHYGNKPEFFVDLLALWCLGACAVPVDSRFTAYEIEQLARAVSPQGSIWDGPVVAGAESVLSTLGIWCGDASELAPQADDGLLAAGLPHLDDDALLLFTSGTTGQSKGVVQTHRSLRSRWNHQRERLGVAVFAHTLCLVPTHFAWGLVGHALYTCICCRPFGPRRCCAWAACATISAPPACPRYLRCGASR
jgi:oxalate---CoA ligase